MTIPILVFGALTALAGIVLLIDPDIIFGVLKRNLERVELHVSAVAVRLVLGSLLVLQSGASRHPLAVEVIGWLSIAAALVFAVMGRGNFKRFISWALSLAGPFGRFGGILAAGFGSFLFYAFV